MLDNQTPKYLNSPETLIFQKGKELYGLFQARKVQKDLSELYIVEGYMDVIALAQFDIKNVVATLGTAATNEHIEKMFRISNKQVYFIFLPSKEDPDTFVRKNGKDAFLNTQMLTPLSEFLFNSIGDNINLEVPEGRSEMINKTLPFLAKLPPDAYKDIVIKELSKITHYEIDDIQKQLSKTSKKDIVGTRENKNTTDQNKGIEKIRWLIRCLLHQPSLALDVKSTDSLLLLKSSGANFLCKLIELIKENPNITVAGILENWRDTQFEKRLCDLASAEDEFKEIGVTNAVFTDAINGLIDKHQKEFETFKTKNSPLELTDEEKSKYRGMQKSTQDT